jgi:hypothetical protein
MQEVEPEQIKVPLLQQAFLALDSKVDLKAGSTSFWTPG